MVLGNSTVHLSLYTTRNSTLTNNSCKIKAHDQILQVRICLTFWIIMSQQLYVKLFSKRSQIGWHHTAGGKINLVTVWFYLEVEKKNHGISTKLRTTKSKW